MFAWSRGLLQGGNLAAALLAVGVAMGAQAQNAPCPLPEDPQVIIDTIWPIVDSNGNGALSLAELEAVAPGYGGLALEYADLNGNGSVSRSELDALLALLGGDPLSLVDTNGDRVISYAEASELGASQEDFSQLDLNNDGRIDCADLGEIAPPEGEDPKEGEDDVYCPIPDDFQTIIHFLWPAVDIDSDQRISVAEMEALSPALTALAFGAWDQDADGFMSYEESLAPIFFFAPLDALAAVDTNGNGVLDYAEVDFMGEQRFSLLDSNNNGVLDCGDIEPGVEGEFEGEDPAEGETGEYCPLPNDIFLLLDFIWPLADADDSGGISLAEIVAWYPDFPAEFFPYADQNRDGEVSLEELHALLPVLESLLPGASDDILGYVDANTNGVIEYQEVADYVDPQRFATVDLNGNGVIDCGDFGGVSPEGEWNPEGEWTPEGEWNPEGENGGYCPLPPDPFTLIHFVWPVLDANGDGGISPEELAAAAPGVVDDAFDLLDRNDDGLITHDEVLALPVLLLGEDGQDFVNGPIPADLLAYVDTNNDGVLSLAEVSDYIEADFFHALDANDNGVIDCGDLGGGVSPGEGAIEPEGEQPPPSICDVIPMLPQVFPLLDTDQSGSVTLEEIEGVSFQFGLIVPDVAELFAALDADSSGGVTREELHRAMRLCAGGVDPSEGEAAPEGEQPGDETRGLHVRRRASGNGFYTPGREIVVETTILAPDNLNVTALALAETLPERWAFTRVLDDGGAVVVPEFGDSGQVRFVWAAVPLFPVTVRYSAGTFTANGPQAILGHAAYRVGGGEELTSQVTATPLGEGWNEAHCHSADYNRDWTISLSELLRVVQFFNLGEIGCGNGDTEDGYVPSAADLLSCTPHSGDYDADWLLELQELLRMIQIYNSPNGAYFVAEEITTDDGFVPGMFELK